VNWTILTQMTVTLQFLGQSRRKNVKIFGSAFAGLPYMGIFSWLPKNEHQIQWTFEVMGDNPWTFGRNTTVVYAHRLADWSWCRLHSCCHSCCRQRPSMTHAAHPTPSGIELFLLTQINSSVDLREDALQLRIRDNTLGPGAFQFWHRWGPLC
jgi:hypothetical protein